MQSSGLLIAAMPVAPSPEPSAAPSRVLPIVLLAAVLLTALLLRLRALGAESLWLDEATSLFLARMNIPTLIAWTAHDIHPPLYYILLHGWRVFGESEFALRSLSAIAGVLAVGGVYLLGRTLFGQMTALLAALLLAVSPLHLWYSQEARMYALVTGLSLFASWHLVMALRAGRRRHWIGYAFWITLALYTHYYTFFVILFHWAAVASWLVVAVDAPAKRTPLLRDWLVAQGAAFALFLPWAPTLIRQVTGGGGAWVAQAVGIPSLRALPETLLLYVVGTTHSAVPALWRRTAYAFHGLAILAALRSGVPTSNRKRLDWGVLFCLLYLLVPLGSAWAISQIKPLFATRYLLPFLPPFLLLVAYGISALPRRALRAFLMLLVVVIPLLVSLQMQATDQNVNWREIASDVVSRAASGDVAIFEPGWYSKPFNYYAHDQIAVFDTLPIPIEPESLDQELSAVLTQHRRAWLIWRSGHYGDRSGSVQQYFDRRYALLDSQSVPQFGVIRLYDLTAPPR